MTMAKSYNLGEKTHRDENFPVASHLIAAKHRPAIMAFYAFARAADDVADHPHFAPQEKIRQLDAFEATLLGAGEVVAPAMKLREVIARSNLNPRHALDLLVAFRQDALTSRYENWEELMQYCAYSAAPVGRFVLDVHGESKAAWPASDALCSALQVINHLQDCKKDYLQLNRVYIPGDALARHKASVEMLANAYALPPLLACLKELAEKTQRLLAPPPLTPQVKDMRLRMEVAVIDRLARRLLEILRTRDPLSERVHLSKTQVIPILLKATLATLAGRAFNP